MEAIAPPALQSGDTIALISTARKVEPKQAETAKKLVESWGFKMKEGRNLHCVKHQLAGTDEERRDDLKAALVDPEVKAILCARGGYGTARILDDIDFSMLKTNPKWIVGYSDVTALHCHAYTVAGVQSIHGSMSVNFADNTKAALESIRVLLTGDYIAYSAPQHRLNRSGVAEGVMVGGNLSVLYSILGSASAPDFQGKILFLEDLDEYVYHIDRMMLALRRAGHLQKLAGIMVGGMTEMRDNPIPFGYTAEEIIAEHCAPYAFPVCFGFPSGHITDNRAWIHGKKTRLTVNHGQPSSVSQS